YLFARRAWAAFIRIDRQSRLSGRVRRSLYFRAARPFREPSFRLDLHVDRSARRFRDAGGLGRARLPVGWRYTRKASRAGRTEAATISAKSDHPAPARQFQSQQTRLLVFLDFS